MTTLLSASTYTTPEGEQRVARLWSDGTRDDRPRIVECPACGKPSSGYRRRDDLCRWCVKAGHVPMTLPFGESEPPEFPPAVMLDREAR